MNQDERARVKAILQALGPCAGKRMLSVGCGDARILSQKEKEGCDIVGIDINPKVIQEDQGRGNGEFILMDAATLMFPDESFDIVLASEVLEHLDDVTLGRAVSEMKRVCRRDGALIVTVPERNCVDGTPACPHVQSFEMADLRAMFNVRKEISIPIEDKPKRVKPRRWIGCIASPAPKVTVVIPSYNNAQFLGSAIESVMNQTLPDWSLLVVEDGSTDDSLDVLQKYPCVRAIIHPTNMGVAKAWSDGFAAARGDCMIILSSDDMLMPNALEMMYNVMQQDKNIVMVYGGILPLDETGTYCEVHMCKDYDYEHLILENYIGGAVMLRRDLRDAKTSIGETVLDAELDEDGACDWGLWLKVGDYVASHPEKRIARVDAPLYVYRGHPNATRFKPGRLERMQRWDHLIKGKANKRLEASKIKNR